MSKLAIVTSCDETYAPLAKGLILSLRAHGFPEAGQRLCLLDIGCSRETLAWMEEQGVETVPLQVKEHIPFRTEHLPRHIAAMAFRPFMKAVFPGSEVYLWIDSDTWVQLGTSIQLYYQLAASNPDCIVISPLIDINYRWLFRAENFHRDMQRIYTAIYGDAGVQLSRRPVLGAGVFAMHQSSPIWRHWGNQLPIVYRRDYTQVPDGLHLAEQTALNRVLYSVGQPWLVEAIHNYHLCAGPAAWVSDQLCTPTAAVQDGQLVQRPIGIVHLCGLRSYAEKYVQARTFFDRGSYLSDIELNAIAGLKKPSSNSY